MPAKNIIKLIIVFVCIFLIITGCAVNNVSDNESQMNANPVVSSANTELATQNDSELSFPIFFSEGNTYGFKGRSGSETLTVKSVTRHDDTEGYALYVDGRTENQHGPVLDVTKYIKPTAEHRASLWIRTDSDTSANYFLGIEIVKDGIASTQRIDSSRLTAAAGWTKLIGTFECGLADKVNIYVESNNAALSFYIDDIDFFAVAGTGYNYDPSLKSLKDVYADYFLLGNIVNPGWFGTIRYDILKYHFNAVTYENNMKPDQIWEWGDKSKIPSFGIDNQMKQLMEDRFVLHGHTLVWHTQSSWWLNKAEDKPNDERPAPLIYEEARENLRYFIDTVAGHYGSRPGGLEVYSWDVLNEAIWADDRKLPGDADYAAKAENWYERVRGWMGDSYWYKAYGNGGNAWDYVYDAFLFAREADPNAILYYNDFGMDNQFKADLVINMAKDINERYAQEHPEANGRKLIEGIGLQEHDGVKTSPKSVEKTIQKIIDIGLRISISEMDVGVEGADKENGLTKEQEAAQARHYAEMFILFKKYSEHIERVTFWGIDDDASWIRDTYGCLFNRDLSPKEAYYAVLDPEGYLSVH